MEQAALQLLQAMFGDCRTEEEKIKMVEDLLDVKLLPGTNLEGVHFNKERIEDRYRIKLSCVAFFMTVPQGHEAFPSSFLLSHHSLSLQLLFHLYDDVNHFGTDIAFMIFFYIFTA